tara:strand:+ start:520 stop:2091 length:1572 start_codon:yes stop_codon:yes gene_type:complete
LTLCLSTETTSIEINTGNILVNPGFTGGNTSWTNHGTTQQHHTYYGNECNPNTANNFSTTCGVTKGSLAGVDDGGVSQTVTLSEDTNMGTPEIQRGFTSTMSSDIWFWHGKDKVTMTQTLTDSSGDVSTQIRIVEDDHNIYKTYTDSITIGANTSTDFNINARIDIDDSSNSSSHAGPDVDNVELSITYNTSDGNELDLEDELDFEDEIEFEDNFTWEEDWTWEEDYAWEDDFYFEEEFDMDWEEFDMEEEFDVGMDWEETEMFEEFVVQEEFDMPEEFEEMEMTPEEEFEEMYMEEFEEFETVEDAFSAFEEVEMPEETTEMVMSEEEETIDIEMEEEEDVVEMDDEPEEMEVAEDEPMEEPKEDEESPESAEEAVEEESESEESAPKTIENEEESMAETDVADKGGIETENIEVSKEIKVGKVDVGEIKITVNPKEIFKEVVTLDNYSNRDFYKDKGLDYVVNDDFFNQLSMIEYSKEIYKGVTLVAYIQGDPVEVYRQELEELAIQKAGIMIELKLLRGE